MPEGDGRHGEIITARALMATIDEAVQGGDDGVGLFVGDVVPCAGHDDSGGVVGPRPDGFGHVADRAVAAGDPQNR